MRTNVWLTTVLLLSTLTLGGVATAAPAADMPAVDAESVGRTPPRLSFVDGQVSFWRPGADDWAEAQVNTALAPGDQLYIQGHGNLELQVGAQAFVRGGDDAQLELVTQEPDFLRFKVTGGLVSFDLRSLGPGRTVEVDTPHAAFTIDHEGYYRLDVADTQSEFATHRTGRATAVAAGGEAVALEPGEAVVVQSPSGQAFAVQGAPALDAWDNWNYDRTDYLLAARSRQYVSDQAYGAGDLDRYGSWRVLPTYGAVWVPGGVSADWAPYSTGSWMHDPYYGWTWVDTAPWGWAPYHYGRWVYVNSYWCWAPGPVVARPYYAPALVAFFGGPAVSVGISIGGPTVGWVALGWGEPLIPWWGRRGFIHRPWWGGWGGPRCINNRVISRRTRVTIHDIHVYRNHRVRHALVVIDKDRFGHGHIRREHHRRHDDFAKWRPTHRAPNIRPSAHSYAPSLRRGSRPSERSLKRSVVTIQPHNRPKRGTIKRLDPDRRTEVRSNRETRHSLPVGNATRITPRRPGPARVDNHPVKRKERIVEQKQLQPRPHKVPAQNRPETRTSNRSPVRIAPKPDKQRHPQTTTNKGSRALPARRQDNPSPPARLPRTTTSPGGSRRIDVPQSAPPVSAPEIRPGNRIERKSPTTRQPAVRVPRRQPRDTGTDPARVAPSQGSNPRPEGSRSIHQYQQGQDNARPPEVRQRSEGSRRPEINRGADFQSRDRLQRRSRN